MISQIYHIELHYIKANYFDTGTDDVYISQLIPFTRIWSNVSDLVESNF